MKVERKICFLTWVWIFGEKFEDLARNFKFLRQIWIFNLIIKVSCENLIFWRIFGRNNFECQHKSWIWNFDRENVKFCGNSKKIRIKSKCWRITYILVIKIWILAKNFQKIHRKTLIYCILPKKLNREKTWNIIF